MEWENTGTVTQSVGTVFIGDSNGDSVILDNMGTYDITDDSGISDGSSTTSDIENAGLFEKTGGTGTSVIAPSVTNDGTIIRSSGKIEFQNAVIGDGNGHDLRSSKIEFDKGVYTSAQFGQDIDFTGGGGGTLALLEPASFYGEISDFGPGDTIKLEHCMEVFRYLGCRRHDDADTPQRLDQARIRVRRRLYAERIQHHSWKDHDHRIRVTPAFAGSISTSSLTGDRSLSRAGRATTFGDSPNAAPPASIVASRDDVCPLHPFEQAIAIRDGQWTLTPDVLLSA